MDRGRCDRCSATSRLRRRSGGSWSPPRPATRYALARRFPESVAGPDMACGVWRVACPSRCSMSCSACACW
eukprot:816950-Rhodomonas_salina.2